jgi:hypothetical protein
VVGSSRNLGSPGLRTRVGELYFFRVKVLFSCLFFLFSSFCSTFLRYIDSSAAWAVVLVSGAGCSTQMESDHTPSIPCVGRCESSLLFGRDRNYLVRIEITQVKFFHKRVRIGIWELWGCLGYRSESGTFGRALSPGDTVDTMRTWPRRSANAPLRGFGKGGGKNTQSSMAAAKVNEKKPEWPHTETFLFRKRPPTPEAFGYDRKTRRRTPKKDHTED